MQEVSVTVSVPGRAPDDVFATLADFARYPEQTDAVIRVDVEQLAEGRERCTWEVRFRRGILIWTEESVTDPVRRRIEFALVGGDLDQQHGYWQVDPTTSGSTIQFWCEFDLGIPTLAHLLEPVAADTLGENVATICAGLFGGAEPRPDDAPHAGPEA